MFSQSALVPGMQFYTLIQLNQIQGGNMVNYSCPNSSLYLLQSFNPHCNKGKRKHCSSRILFSLLFVSSTNNKYVCIGFSPMALSCSFWQEAPVQLNMPANTRPLLVASPNIISCHVSSLLLETPLSLTSLFSLGGIDALEKDPAEWNSPFLLQLGIVT